MDCRKVIENAFFSPEEKLYQKVKERLNLPYRLNELVVNIRVKRSERPLLSVYGATEMDGRYLIILRVVKGRGGNHSRFRHYNGMEDTVLMSADGIVKYLVSVERKGN